MRVGRIVRAVTPRSLAARTTLAAALTAAVLFTGGAWWMRHDAYNQQMGVASDDANLEANLLIDSTSANDTPSGDDWGRFPYELVTSAGLLSSSSQLDAFEVDKNAFMLLPAYYPGSVKTIAPTVVEFPDVAAVRGNPLAGMTTQVVSQTTSVASLRAEYNVSDIPGLPTNGMLRAYVFVTPFNAQAAVSALDRILYPGVPTAVLLVAAVAYAATRRALRPVEAIRLRTAAVTATDPRERVRVPDTGDEIARLAVTINQTLQRLDDAAQAQRRFVADAAHELRSPLSSLLTTLEVAEAYPEQADWPETVATTAQQARRIHALAEDLLLLARMDATDLANGSARTVELAALACDTAAECRARSAADLSGRHISVTCHADAPVLVRGDRTGLELVLRNLTDNAMRYACTRVDVRVYPTEDEAVIEVEDDGPGVPAADRERIFERFTRLDDARSRETGGFGLGLAIVRDVVERRHGTIEVADADADADTGTDADTGAGTGTRFTVRLPRMPD
jgi:signal transduction histidine kinase